MRENEIRRDDVAMSILVFGEFGALGLSYHLASSVYTMTMQLEEQLRQRLHAARESIRSKYKALQSAARPNDPIRRYLADEIEKELKGVRDSLSHDEIVQVQARIDAVRASAGPMLPSVIDPSNPNLFAELQDEYHFLQRLLE